MDKEKGEKAKRVEKEFNEFLRRMHKENLELHLHFINSDEEKVKEWVRTYEGEREEGYLPHHQFRFAINNSALSDKCVRAFLGAVKEPLQRYINPQYAHHHDRYGSQVPIVAAVSTGCIGPVKVLVELGCPLDGQYGKWRDLSLMHILVNDDFPSEVFSNHGRLVRYLHESGAPINDRDRMGVTALGYAIRRGDVEMAKLLREFGATE